MVERGGRGTASNCSRTPMNVTRVCNHNTREKMWNGTLLSGYVEMFSSSDIMCELYSDQVDSWRGQWKHHNYNTCLMKTIKKETAGGVESWRGQWRAGGVESWRGQWRAGGVWRAAAGSVAGAMRP